MTEPSPMGLRRYSSTDEYVELSATEHVACICNETCTGPYCSGVRCGCAACAVLWAETLDEKGLSSTIGYTISDEEGRERFGPNWPDV